MNFTDEEIKIITSIRNYSSNYSLRDRCKLILNCIRGEKILKEYETNFDILSLLVENITGNYAKVTESGITFCLYAEGHFATYYQHIASDGTVTSSVKYCGCCGLGDEPLPKIVGNLYEDGIITLISYIKEDGVVKTLDNINLYLESKEWIRICEI